MSDEGLEQVRDPEEVQDPNIRQRMRDTEKENADLKERLQRVEREAAFDKAGIPTDGPGALLRDSYSGPADPQAVKEAAEKYGILGQPTTEESPFADELETQRRMQGAVRGRSEPEPDAMDRFEATLAETRRDFKPGSPESAEASKDRVVAALQDLGNSGSVSGLNVKQGAYVDPRSL